MGMHDRRDSLAGDFNTADRLKSLERRVRELELRNIDPPDLKDDPRAELRIMQQALIDLLERVISLEARLS